MARVFGNFAVFGRNAMLTVKPMPMRLRKPTMGNNFGLQRQVCGGRGDLQLSGRGVELVNCAASMLDACGSHTRAACFHLSRVSTRAPNARVASRSRCHPLQLQAVPPSLTSPTSSCVGGMITIMTRSPRWLKRLTLHFSHPCLSQVVALLPAEVGEFAVCDIAAGPVSDSLTQPPHVAVLSHHRLPYV